MFRALAPTSPRDLKKLGACVLLLLTPGSFIFLPAYWLVRRLAGAARAKSATVVARIEHHTL